MADLITVADLEARLGHTLTGGLNSQAAALITDATALVRQSASPKVVDDPPLTPPAIVAVMVSAVRRAIANPLARSGEAIDGHQWQEGGATGVFLKTEEIKEIRRAVGKLGVNSAVMENDLPLRSSFGFEEQLIDLLE